VEFNFLKPMGEFSGERNLVNAELGDVLAKTMPFFAVDFERMAVGLENRHQFRAERQNPAGK
jgi:hypothetical protein